MVSAEPICTSTRENSLQRYVREGRRSPLYICALKWKWGGLISPPSVSPIESSVCGMIIYTWMGTSGVGVL